MKSRRLLLLGAIIPISILVLFKWVAIPYLQSYLLAQHNIQLVFNNAYPSFHISPFSIGIGGIEFEIRGTTQDMPYAFTVYVEQLEYRLLRPSSSTRLISSSQNGVDKLPFARISCSNATLVVHEPHPQPRLEVLDTQATLLTPTIREMFFNVKEHIFFKREFEREEQDEPLGLLIQLEVMSMRLTTHTVTSNLIGLSHLSLLTPSIILPAVYRQLSAFRQLHYQGDDHHYKIPVSFPLSPIEVKFQQHGRSQIKDIQVHLLPSGKTNSIEQQTYQCSDIGVAHIRQIYVTGRDSAGGGGCCALYVGHVSNIEVNAAPIHASTSSSLLSTLLDIAMHPVYLAAFIHSVHSSLASNDICTIKDLLVYHIHEVEWADMTPLPSSLLDEVTIPTIRGLLYLFSPVIDLIL